MYDEFGNPTREFNIGERVLLVYPQGDCDVVEVLSLDGSNKDAFSAAYVRLPSGESARTLQEDLGFLEDGE